MAGEDGVVGGIEARCGEVYSDGPGMPPLSMRLMAGLAILQHTFNLSDEELCVDLHGELTREGYKFPLRSDPCADLPPGILTRGGHASDRQPSGTPDGSSGNCGTVGLSSQLQRQQ